MKLFLISLLFIDTLFATDAKEAAQKLGVENHFATAMEKARSEKKMLVMIVVKEGCRWCDKLVYRTLAESEVKESLKNYVTLIIDKDDDYPKDFKENFPPRSSTWITLPAKVYMKMSVMLERNVSSMI